MAVDIDQLALYLHLARASELRRRPLVRDRLLVIAGSLAAESKLPRIAALCRMKVLEHNVGHMLRRLDNFSIANDDADFQKLLKQLRRRFPAEKAEQMLQSLGVDRTGERDAYYSDEEYAASIWGLTVERLHEMFPDAA